MSVQAISWVLENSTSKGRERLVLIAVANHAGWNPETNAWESWPGLVRIAREANVGSTRTAQRALAKLAEEGHIEIVVHGEPDSRVRADRRANLYRIPIDDTTPVVTSLPLDVADDDTTPAVTSSDESRGDRSDATTRQIEHDDTTPAVTRTKSNQEQPSDLHFVQITASSLCEYLADRVQEHRGGSGRPTISEKWHRDMRLLIERGPLHVDDVKSVDPDRVRRAIEFVFDHLADPSGSDGFCWADQIRSAGALRDHWQQLLDAGKRMGVSMRGRNATLIDAGRQSDAPSVSELLDRGAAIETTAQETRAINAQ